MPWKVHAPTTTQKDGIQKCGNWREKLILLPVRRRRKYRDYEKRLMTIREKYEAGDYSLSELVKACSH